SNGPDAALDVTAAASPFVGLARCGAPRGGDMSGMRATPRAARGSRSTGPLEPVAGRALRSWILAAIAKARSAWKKRICYERGVQPGRRTGGDRVLGRHGAGVGAAGRGIDPESPGSVDPLPD